VLFKEVVLDTSVVVSALRSLSGASNALLRRAAQHGLVPLATPPLFLEYEDVLKRPEQQLAHKLSLQQIDEFLAELAALIKPVQTHFLWRPHTHDPNDEMVLEAAINGRADVLVTHNVSDFLIAGKRFRIPVMTPSELPKEMRK
jgi:putative PIN family toxin of toxin-antitoxin system